MKLKLWMTFGIIISMLSSCNFLELSTGFESAMETLINQGEDTELKISDTPQPVVSTPLHLTLTHTPEIPTETVTVSVTDTPEPPPTETSIPTKVIPTATLAPLGAQIGSPVAVKNFAHPELGCEWMGLAGQILDGDDQPMKDLVVEVGGTLEGRTVFGLAISGEADAYGPGGYEIVLGEKPVASSATIWVQVYDLNGDLISSPTFFSTYSDCDKNLIILNFVQSYKLPKAWFYLPAIHNRSSNK